jgi:phage protein D
VIVMAEPIYLNETFLAPQFIIALQGKKLGNEVVKDVLQVSYKDDLENLDSFEFTLHDWDPLTGTTKYSSPYDESGNLRKIGGTKLDVPNFKPGVIIELFVGYYASDTKLPLMMSGKVATAAVSFPASGTPTLTVRVLNLLFDLQKSQENLTFEGKKPTEIAQEIAASLDIELINQRVKKTLVIPFEEQVIPFTGMNSEYPILFLSRLARKQGYDLFVDASDEKNHKLFFGIGQRAQQELELEWGKSLIQFTPVLKTKDIKSSAVVRGWDPLQSGAQRNIEGEATWTDLDISMPDSKLLEQIKFATENAAEEITDQPVSSQQAAEELAKAALRRIVQQVITGSGSTIGTPKLRAGTRITLKGLGLRYSYEYLVFDSTHKIDGSGYVTDFSARMEVVNG